MERAVALKLIGMALLFFAIGYLLADIDNGPNNKELKSFISKQ